jgi:hypothetical protein
MAAMKAKIHFDNEFCEQTVEQGLSRRVIIRYLKILREHPELGVPIVPEIPAFREWKVDIQPYGPHKIGFLWAWEYGDIDLSYIQKVDPSDPPTKVAADRRNTLEWLLLLAKLGAMVVKIIKEILSIST